jgi:hypothetical protein
VAGALAAIDLQDLADHETSRFQEQDRVNQSRFQMAMPDSPAAAD